MPTAISIENLSKHYQLGTIGTGTLSHDLNRWWASLRGKEDPFLRIGDSQVENKNSFWALKDISFNIEQGSAVGIIGKNGAGKSTLLKILSRVTSPTTGNIKVKGRIASLLEVGTGFHPELTGRENIFLNGAILGMTKNEIKSKLDEIIEFSGVSQFVDTPVKRYSSGMYVRLAFAVAAHLEPEILIVDEVLAVGDAEFQKKCLGKMKDVSGEGRTVIFVSHNMAAVHQLCNEVVYLKAGVLQFRGSVNEGLARYNDSINSSKERMEELLLKRNVGNKKAYIADAEVIRHQDRITINILVKAIQELSKTEIAVGINDEIGNRIITFHSRFTNQTFDLKEGINKLTCEASNINLKTGAYSMNIFVGNKYETLDFTDTPLDFDIPEYVFYPGGITPDSSHGSVMTKHNWEIKDLI